MGAFTQTDQSWMASTSIVRFFCRNPASFFRVIRVLSLRGYPGSSCVFSRFWAVGW
jgi:hypothetical protein